MITTIVSMILVALLFIGVSRLLFPKRKQQDDPASPTVTVYPEYGVEKVNDKLIVLTGTSYEDVTKAVTACCKQQNQEESSVFLRVTKLPDGAFAITFPYDVDFGVFCCVVNYLHYPEGLDYSVAMLAWTTTRASDQWITHRSANKVVMLYIPADDKEYDNVYLTTTDGIGYKLGFAGGEEKQLLTSPVEDFIAPPFAISYLQEKPFEDFQ